MIAGILEMDVSLHETCDILVERALEKGGRDNITVIVVKYTEH